MVTKVKICIDDIRRMSLKFRATDIKLVDDECDGTNCNMLFCPKKNIHELLIWIQFIITWMLCECLFQANMTSW